MRSLLALTAVVFTLIAIALLLTGCDFPLDSTDDIAELATSRECEGTLRLLLTDFPLRDKDVRQVWVNIRSVEVCGEDSGRQVVVDNGTLGETYELLTLAGDVALLGFSDLEAGLYSQIRLVLGVDNRIVVLEEGELREYSLETPSAQTSGVKITGGFEIRGGGVTEIVLDFDAQKSVVLRGNGDYLLKPTIAIEEIRESITLSLISPEFGAILSTDTPYFEWTDLPDAVQYNLFAGLDSNRESYQVNIKTISSSGQFAQFSDGQYYWWVRALDDDGVWGPWSETGFFTVSTSGL